MILHSILCNILEARGASFFLAGFNHMILHSTGGSPIMQIFGIVENRPRYRNSLSN